MAKDVPPPIPEPRGIGQGVWVAACLGILIFAAVMAVVVPSFTAKIKQMTETIEQDSRTAYVAPSVLPKAPVGRVHAMEQKLGRGYFAVTAPDDLWYCMYVRKEGERGWRDVPQLSSPDITNFTNNGGYFSFVVNTPVTIKYYKHADGPMRCFP